MRRRLPPVQTFETVLGAPSPPSVAAQEGLTDELVELAAGLRGHALQMQHNVAESSRVLDSIEARLPCVKGPFTRGSAGPAAERNTLPHPLRRGLWARTLAGRRGRRIGLRRCMIFSVRCDPRLTFGQISHWGFNLIETKDITRPPIYPGLLPDVSSAASRWGDVYLHIRADSNQQRQGTCAGASVEKTRRMACAEDLLM